MCIVNLDDVESSSERTFGGGDEGPDDSLDALLGQFLGSSMCRIERDCTWGNNFIGPAIEDGRDDSTRMYPGCIGTCFTSGVCKLDTYLLVLRVCEVNDGFPGIGLLIKPDTDVLWSNSAFWGYSGGFNKRETRSTTDNTAN